jgi:hypothetical protein
VLVLHLVNRLLAVLLGLAVVAAAALLCVEVVRWFTGSDPWIVPWSEWASWAREASAEDRGVMLASAAAVLLGLLLLLFELKPRRPDALGTEPLLDGVKTVTTRRGVRSAATTGARSVGGVLSADAEVRRRTVKVTARTRARGEAAQLRERVRGAVQSRLDDLQLTRRPTVRVQIREES